MKHEDYQREMEQRIFQWESMYLFQQQKPPIPTPYVYGGCSSSFSLLNVLGRNRWL